MSSETSLIAALNGCPARSARFMMSTASGSCSSNFSRRCVRSRADLEERRGAARDGPEQRERHCRVKTSASSARGDRERDRRTSRCASIVCPACSMVSRERLHDRQLLERCARAARARAGTSRAAARRTSSAPSPRRSPRAAACSSCASSALAEDRARSAPATAGTPRRRRP